MRLHLLPLPHTPPARTRTSNGTLLEQPLLPQKEIVMRLSRTETRFGKRRKRLVRLRCVRARSSLWSVLRQWQL